MGKFGEKNKDVLVQSMQQQIIRLLLISCDSLNQDMIIKGEKLTNDEGAITYRLIEYYLNNDDFRRKHHLDTIMMRFQPEYPINFQQSKNNYIGRLDMQVINVDYFRNTECYGNIECKRLDGGSHLNREYVKEGIERFVGEITGVMKYPRHIGADMMLGYFVAALDAEETIKQINTYLKRKMPGKVQKEITFQKVKKDEWYYCESSLVCLDDDKRDINHLFYYFDKIIE